ncbi:MAG: NAD+ synthase [Sphingobacteriales bacterium]|jgi:NAD+ synthase (glutamine-hydrolysing)|nr:NAD+ synthase [Sphingobacteriales bacterium]MBP9140982.1 NAD+ synthase [Chitinophagales bacterium]MDA0198608.1 NAD+ synthase [Bacteroidota bacterium]MBK6890248.1 NAD+ synthase [Sphingobacteriales bacterium]MBK7527225.1 NAD+ synthase [Sphingobacteriales bacterium]
MKIAIAQQNYHIGNFEANFAKIQQGMEQAQAQGADVVVFTELCVCGYPANDFLDFRDFVSQCYQVVERVKTETQRLGIAAVIGSPTRNPNIQGKDLFNSALFIANGQILHTSNKTLLPNYDVFDEYRYFEPGRTFDTFEFMGYRIAMVICEDIWNLGNENPMYTICPLDELKAQNPDFIINVSASPFTYTHAHERLHTIRANVQCYQLPMIYANCTGAQTNLIFDGGSIVMNYKGQVIDEMPFFEECVRTYELAPLLNPAVSTILPTSNHQYPDENQTKTNNEQPKEKYELIYRALITGISNYFGKMGFQKAILGLSGGLDSALVAVLASHALGPQNVRLVLMPSAFSSDHSINDGLQLAKNLGCPHDILPIQPVFEAFLAALEKPFLNTSFNVAEENLQARIRANYLMGLANKFGYILLNTSNKSEAAVGYGTLYGDMCGGISVIGDLYKTEAYELCSFINRMFGNPIPENIITKIPSAELRPGQKDSDSLPPYPTLDAILYQYIEQHKGPDEIIAQGYDAALVTRVLRMVNQNEWKRYQTPPMLRISGKAFGSGRRLPIVGKYLG